MEDCQRWFGKVEKRKQHYQKATEEITDTVHQRIFKLQSPTQYYNASEKYSYRGNEVIEINKFPDYPCAKENLK